MTSRQQRDDAVTSRQQHDETYRVEDVGEPRVELLEARDGEEVAVRVGDERLDLSLAERVRDADADDARAVALDALRLRDAKRQG